MRPIPTPAIDLIEAAEGFSAVPYLCPAGWWTIGYGAIWDASGHRVTSATPPIDMATARALLERDTQLSAGAVLRLCSVPLTDGQYGALVDFTFNLGAGRLQASTLRQKLLRLEYAEIPTELARWVWGGGRILPGLVKRRAAEVALWRAP